METSTVPTITVEKHASIMREDRTHQYVVEASSLEWAPGFWPQTIETDYGNGKPFRLAKVLQSDGDFLGALYMQQFGCLTLTVFND